MTPFSRLALASSCAFGFAAFTLPASAQTGAEILADQCSACHVTDAAGKIDRIDAVRKTPEAWDMTVVRMMRNHGLELSDAGRIAVVRHLADTRGLSLAEAEPWRYILEREPVASDAGPDVLMTQTCSRCHSYARVALQRRSGDDWKKLIHFHLGQYPTLEYQALARDRDWLAIAETQVLDFLTKTYPLGDAPAPLSRDLSGSYVLAGHQPGQGRYQGSLTLAKDGADYTVEMVLRGAVTGTFKGRGRVTGAGEWRASLADGDREIRQVFAVNSDGQITGRWFEAQTDVNGGRLTALPAKGKGIAGLSQSRLRLGEPGEIVVTGAGLGEALTLPEGVTGAITARSDDSVTLKLTAEGAPRLLELALGDQAFQIAAWDKIDRLSVSPQTTLSRVGGAGGGHAKVPAQFEALGWLNGPDGQPETADDIALGPFEASWRIDNFDAAATAMKDDQYTGSIDAKGLFTPADAGLNPERPMKTNNVGNLKVLAEVKDGAQTLQAEAHLYATVQRFVDAPIR